MRVKLGFLLLAALLPTVGCGMPGPIRLMSFNIRYGTASDGENDWAHRRELVFETIRAYGPDILGVQEVLDFQLDDLLNAFEDFDYVGVGRDDGQSAGEFVPILYRRNLFSPVRAGHFWLSEQPEQPGSQSWDSSLPRMATWVQLRFRKSPQNIIQIINTHFDHRGEQARLELAKLIRRSVEIQAGSPLIVMGDFNCGPDSEPYRVLTDDKGNLAELFDPYVRLGHAEAGAGTYHAFRGTRDGRRIDWILHNRRFEPPEAGINHRSFDGRFPSDHFPVTATLRLVPVTRWGTM